MATTTSHGAGGAIGWRGVSRPVAVAAAIGTIWGSVVLTSVFAPDFVSGSEQEHIPLAAFLGWFWGLVATGYVVAARRPPSGGERTVWTSFLAAIGAIWLATTLAAIFAPEFVTGDDPTRIPIAAIIGPPVATLATAFAALFASGSGPSEGD